MVDVELVVSGGAPRSVFHLLEHVPGHLPSWRLDVEELRDLGWSVDDHSISPPPSDDDGAPLLANHLYALGSVWRGESLGGCVPTRRRNRRGRGCDSRVVNPGRRA